MQSLSSPLALCHARLPNRIVMTALPSGLAGIDGFIDDSLMAYYLARAQGGVGMLVIEPTYALPPPDNGTTHLGLYADAQVSDLYHCVAAARNAGATTLVMLDQPLALERMSGSEVDSVGEAFIEAAWRTRAAGADGIMLSTADGGPFDQLVSPLRNHRTDRHGGGIDRRMRLLLNVVEGIQRWIGDRFIIGVRINAEEFAPGGLALQDARVIAKRLSSTGVKLLEIVAAIKDGTPVAQFPGWRVPLAAGIKAVVDVPVMVGGQLDDADLADSIIRDGGADLIALGDRLRVEPDWPRQALASLTDN